MRVVKKRSNISRIKFIIGAVDYKKICYKIYNGIGERHGTKNYLL